MDVPATPVLETNDVEERYTFERDNKLGAGAFSTVVRATTKPDGLPRAIKVMPRSMLTDPRTAQIIAHEKEILRRTQHPNVIRLYESIKTPDHVLLVLEQMQCDLFDYIKKRKQFPEAEAASMIKQLLSAVAYLHSILVIHRDIKPENVLVRELGDGQVELKLADFGLAKILKTETTDNIQVTPCGTSIYIAPEIIWGIQQDGARPRCTSREEAKCLDIWSCGVVLYILLTGKPPFMGQVRTRDGRRDLLSKIDQGLSFPPDLSDEAKDLCQKLLTQDTQRRITADVALLHPFLRLAQPIDRTLNADSGAGDGRESPDEVSQQRNAEMNELIDDMREISDQQEGEPPSHSGPKATAPLPRPPILRKVPPNVSGAPH